MKIKLIFLLLLIMAFSHAQQGPVIECFNCEGLENRPYPANGNWYNPEQSGSGYILDVQGGLLSGFYFGYDADGKAIWTNFSGFLEEGEGEVKWTFDGDMLAFENGNAHNQPHQFPEAVATSDTIHIDFLFRHYARVSINGGEPQNMVPLTYGVAVAPDLEDTDFLFPDLEGIWTFVYDENEHQHSVFDFTSRTFHITTKFVVVNAGNRKSIEYGINFIAPPNEVVGVGILTCSNFDDDDIDEVVCIVRGFPAAGQQMVVPIGDLGPFKFTFEGEDGLTITAYKVNSAQLP